MDNLPELRDIHIPEGVSMFPPAYGWWVILGGIAAAFVLIELFRFIRRKSKKLYALRLLKDIDTHNNILSAVQMSELLRRICVYKYKEAVTLFGQSWINFLNEHAKHKISGKTAQLLLDAPYVSLETKTYSQEDVQKLHDFCQKWIGENL